MWQCVFTVFENPNNFTMPSKKQASLGRSTSAARNPYQRQTVRGTLFFFNSNFGMFLDLDFLWPNARLKFWVSVVTQCKSLIINKMLAIGELCCSPTTLVSSPIANIFKTTDSS